MENGIGKVNIRKAEVSDAEQFMRIKAALPMPKNSETATGGFILGTDIETYKYYIANGIVYIAEHIEAVGFAIILPHEIVTETEIWKKRHQANWTIDISELENKRICYFEQLAFLPNFGFAAAETTYLIANEAFKLHDYILATTVKKPILNKAAWRFIREAGGKCVGTIDENYSEIGQILSDIHLISAEMYQAKLLSISTLNSFSIRHT